MGSKKERRLVHHKQHFYLTFLGASILVILMHFLVVKQFSYLHLRGAFNEPRDFVGDIIHLNNLNEVCFHEKKAVIPWTYNSSDVDRTLVWNREDLASLIDYLAECPEVDVFLPEGLRNHGYCEDGMAYVKYLNTRALPGWVFDIRFNYQGQRNITYFELCPKSAILVMNHYSDGIPQRNDFPKNKPMILMPNVEMYELKETQYLQFDYILCKTKDAYNRLTKWFNDNENPRNATLLYVQHTSSDPSTLARTYSQSHSDFTIKPKDFENITFFHANGHSAQKSTKNIFQCWQKRPDFPTLDVYSMYSGTKEEFDQVFGSAGAPPNVRFHYGEDIDAPHFGRLLLEASTILCPSKMEGFGHYINQARASGAVVLTTDGTPMNELVDDNSGVLIHAYAMNPNPNQLLSQYGAMEWDVPSEDICAAVNKVLAMSPTEREVIGLNGRRRYEQQVVDFRNNMNNLRKLLLKD
ncbi:hypothetical protein THRCLA_00142 [Thraustotheca clavata]|uniref:Glycosyl transferase family 1 domain-containing protein n=1 Tax=Thraustotheca clavata TaxID=74557 RepID=A0A1W0ACI9_9STRA|nr:hypothetical protein THRCLA_00142 [Thraustotheca clavata]